jgi:hypothetical protein
MNLWNKSWVLIGCLASLPSASGQVVHVGSRPAQIAGRGPAPRIGAGSITMAAMPGTVNLNLVSGRMSPPSQVVITTSWLGLALLSKISMYAYFNDPNAALSGGAPLPSIPSSCVLGKDASSSGGVMAAAFTPFTQAGPLGSGSSLQLVSGFSILGLGSGTRVDTLTLEIDLSTLPQLPAGIYTGMLMLETQAL